MGHYAPECKKGKSEKALITKGKDWADTSDSDEDVSYALMATVEDKSETSENMLVPRVDRSGDVCGTTFNYELYWLNVIDHLLSVLKMGLTKMVVSLSILVILFWSFSSIIGQPISSGTEAENTLVDVEIGTKPIKQKDDTVRVDPLDHLKKYRGGYEIRDLHYWSCFFLSMVHVLSRNQFCHHWVRFHYGHPDLFDRVFHLTRGGISKASKTINLSEDVFAGYNTTLRQGYVTYHEYMQVGKGRDVGLNQISKFEAKVANGNSEQTISCDIYLSWTPI
ncbi:hypothetical protein POM88_001033 [Heracleum sosnowskyi]|uniref:Glycosyl transferase 48 domain-containing protein n=1 Tax=Heracleum sosnowskyi TaxID=360622 RepID=A0AAD8JE51_9APIA|nr:hypothetical protein POM88_001033 [Heracleum sosnowskyi]